MTTETDKAMQDNNIEPNAERIKLWTDALESGEHKQGRNALLEDDRYCCLGVACDIYRLHSGDKTADWIQDDNGDWGFRARGSEHEAIMVDPVAKWFGVDKNPVIMVDGREDYCTGHNDGATEISFTVQPKTFSEIAAGIKRLVQDAG